MSAPPTFPTLAGQGWSVFRRLATSTRISRHVSGREVRAQNFVYPLYNFEVSYDGLRNGQVFPNLGDVNALQGFIAALGGPFQPFLYVDPAANATTAAVIGTGDGTTTLFPLLRRVGRVFREPVGYVTTLTAVRVYPVTDDRGFVANDPVASTTDYQAASGSLDLGSATGAFTTPAFTLVSPASVQLATAPPAGATIQADFAYAFLCRFDEDTQEFENVMSGLWRMQSLKFSTFR